MKSQFLFILMVFESVCVYSSQHDSSLIIASKRGQITFTYNGSIVNPDTINVNAVNSAFLTSKSRSIPKQLLRFNFISELEIWNSSNPASIQVVFSNFKLLKRMHFFTNKDLDLNAQDFTILCPHLKSFSLVAKNIVNLPEKLKNDHLEHLSLNGINGNIWELGMNLKSVSLIGHIKNVGILRGCKDNFRLESFEIIQLGDSDFHLSYLPDSLKTLSILNQNGVILFEFCEYTFPNLVELYIHTRAKTEYLCCLANLPNLETVIFEKPILSYKRKKVNQKAQLLNLPMEYW